MSPRPQPDWSPISSSINSIFSSLAIAVECLLRPLPFDPIEPARRLGGVV
jgi:hypothetical protein